MSEPNGQDKKNCNCLDIAWQELFVLAVGCLLCLVKIGVELSWDLSRLQEI
jgi:hypothetical protein